MNTFGHTFDTKIKIMGGWYICNRCGCSIYLRVHSDIKYIDDYYFIQG